MDVGMVSFDTEMASSVPVTDLGFDVLWVEEPIKLPEAMAASPVQALLIPIDVSSSDKILATLLCARAVGPKTRVLLLCCTPGQARVLCEITNHFPAAKNGRGPREVRHLTPRQARVLGDIRAGMTNREIALALGVSLSTVNRHVEHILRKLGVRNRAQAAAQSAEKR